MPPAGGGLAILACSSFYGSATATVLITDPQSQIPDFGILTDRHTEDHPEPQSYALSCVFPGRPPLVLEDFRQGGFSVRPLGWLSVLR